MHTHAQPPWQNIEWKLQQEINLGGNEIKLPHTPPTPAAEESQATILKGRRPLRPVTLASAESMAVQNSMQKEEVEYAACGGPIRTQYILIGSQ